MAVPAVAPAPMSQKTVCPKPSHLSLCVVQGTLSLHSACVVCTLSLIAVEGFHTLKNERITLSVFMYPNIHLKRIFEFPSTPPTGKSVLQLRLVRFQLSPCSCKIIPNCCLCQLFISPWCIFVYLFIFIPPI